MATRKCVVTGGQALSLQKKLGEIFRQLHQERGAAFDPSLFEMMLQDCIDGRFDLLDYVSTIYIYKHEGFYLPDLLTKGAYGAAKIHDIDPSVARIFIEKAACKWMYGTNRRLRIHWLRHDASDAQIITALGRATYIKSEMEDVWRSLDLMEYRKVDWPPVLPEAPVIFYVDDCVISCYRDRKGWKIRKSYENEELRPKGSYILTS
jgi:hypothetical protein